MLTALVSHRGSARKVGAGALVLAACGLLVVGTSCSSSAKPHGDAGAAGAGGKAAAGAGGGAAGVDGGHAGSGGGVAGAGGGTAGADGGAGAGDGAAPDASGDADGDGGSVDVDAADRAGTDGPGEAPFTCTPVLNQAGLDTGFDDCSDDSHRRRVAIQCPEPPKANTSPCVPADAYCKSDAECTTQPLGYCANAHNVLGYCGCFYGCRKDSDCATGSICQCGPVGGICVAAACASAAECGAGSACVLTTHGAPSSTCIAGRPSSFVRSYSCLKPADGCHGDRDCPSSGMDFGTCFIDGDHRFCGLTCFSI